MTTKNQEREALAKIRKIVEGLGADSYIGAAFEGCFEVAETNIENDWACSMKQRAESAEAKSKKLELDNRDLRIAIKKEKEEASKKQTELQEKLNAFQEKLNAFRNRALHVDDLADCKQLAEDAAFTAEKEMKAAAANIVTFAEDPQSPNFQNAVKIHRAKHSQWNYLLALKSRIEKAAQITNI